MEHQISTEEISAQLRGEVKPSSEGWKTEHTENGMTLESKDVSGEAKTCDDPYNRKAILSEMVFKSHDLYSSQIHFKSKSMMRRDLHEYLERIAKALKLTLVRSRYREGNRTMWQVALVDVQSDGDWTPVEIFAHHKGLNAAGMGLLLMLKERFGV